MATAPVGSRYPPDTFNHFDRDKDRSLKRIFHRVFDPTEPIEVATAAKLIDAYYPLYDDTQYGALQRSLEAGENSLTNPETVTEWIIADFFIPLAKQIPFDHPSGQHRLIDLLLALGALPPKPEWSRPDGGRKVWESADRAGLSGVMHYEYDGELFTATSENLSNVAAQQEARNFNSWAALLHARNVGDYSLYALWCIRDALEVPESIAGTALEYRVPRAADWIIRAGSVLATCDKDYGRAGMGKELWKEKNRSCGFAIERWRFWKSRFLLIADMDFLSQATRDIATIAAGKINWVGT